MSNGPILSIMRSYFGPDLPKNRSGFGPILTWKWSYMIFGSTGVEWLYIVISHIVWCGGVLLCLILDIHGFRIMKDSFQLTPFLPL